MSTIQDKKNLKRLRLLDSAYSLFVEKSVNSTAIDDVVKAAGVAKGTFYLYFHDKYDLLNQIIAHKSAEAIRTAYISVRKIDSETPLPFIDGVVLFTEKLIDYMDEHREILTLIDKNLSLSLESLSLITDEGFRDVMDLLKDEFLKNGYTLDEAKTTIYILVDMVGSVCSDAILYRRPYTMQQIKPTLLNAVRSILVGKVA